ncbi:APC family permease [Streptomyces bambusae]|uniref:Amino acid permease n=1 Tax=Streptomyces bambusae TaxID=1550616 RepID=A0ABS6ZG53_9ACTN|nr:APC family permease [Streptomyces bambusae]MBW5486728.1 amino acid permease [Streptomyces bambusae]
MSTIPDLTKRVLLGRALRSEQQHGQLLPKRIALPIFASDALSSVAYAPQEIMLTLGVAGLAAYHFTPWIAAGVVVVLLTVVASYRQNVRAYTSGGGDFEVATTNLGERSGLVVAAALLCDYVLTVAVSVSAAVENLGATLPFLAEHKVQAAICVVALIALMNLRGVRESGAAFAVPTYAFMLAVLGMVVWGGIRLLTGDELRSETAGLTVEGESAGIAGFALVFLILRAFSSGCTALTGVEAISNGVPAFRKPKGENAATTLVLLGAIGIVMFGGVTALAYVTDAKFADPVHGSRLVDPATGEQVSDVNPVIAQVARTVFEGFSPAFYFVIVMTGLILVLAANTAFNGFPVLGSILARNRFMPRQLHTRGDRLAFSNGIVILAAAAGLLIYAYDAAVTQLIPLYTVGVFVSFTISQVGMVRHWNRLLPGTVDARGRTAMRRARAVNTLGAFTTGLVLAVVLATKFASGAWLVCLAMAGLYALMRVIRRHYDRVAEELAPDEQRPVATLPGRMHVIVLVSQLHKPTIRAVEYAHALRPDTLQAITVSTDPEAADELRTAWEGSGMPVPLSTLDSPYREITRPVLDFVHRFRGENPDDVVAVFIPEYVVGRWWENLLHNQSALRLKARLLFQPGVMVASVPWQLASSERAGGRPERAAPGAVRKSRPHRH